MQTPHPDSLSSDELIGLMLMVGVRGDGVSDPVFAGDIEACRAARVGGVILFDVHLPAFVARREAGEEPGTARLGATRNIVSAGQTAALSGLIRERLGDHAIVSIDQEGGKVARLGASRGFPETPSASLFARLGPEERRRAAGELAGGVRLVGVDMNFTPCIDADVNPENPIIALKGRSFGVDPEVIAACAVAHIEAHAEAGVVSCLKHFPGHGSSAADTHAGFADITASWRADPELSVYHRLVPRLNTRRTCVMTGHLFHAGIDRQHPASLSRAHTTGLLRETLGFAGVVITDALDMGAVTQRYSRGEALVLAVNAGADILLDGFNGVPGVGDGAAGEPHPAPAMHEALARALRNGGIDGGIERLRESARRILALRR